jgi:transposase-like protein
MYPLRAALYSALEFSVPGRAFPDEIIALAVHWYVRYRLSYAEVGEWLEHAIGSSETTPRRVISHKAATYPPALAAAVPGVRHRTGRYRTNGIERDHGFLKERLRPMRGLKSVASAAVFIRGHALMRNIRRGFYQLIESAPLRLVLRWTWSRLAAAV